MSEGKGLRIGGYVSGGLLIFFGIAVIVLGIWGFAFTRDHIEREGISFGPIEDPAVAEHAPDWAGEPVDTGRKALAQAEIMREHTLSNTGGSGDGAGHGIHVGDARDLQHHRRDRLAVDGHRPGDPGEGGVRTSADRRTGCVVGRGAGNGSRIALPGPVGSGPS